MSSSCGCIGKAVRKLVVAAVVSFSSAAFAGSKANPDAIEFEPLPRPVEFRSDMDKPVAFDASATVVVDCPDEAAAGWLSSHFAGWYGDQSPKVVVGTSGLKTKTGDEAYAVSADVSGVKIMANTLAGVRWQAPEGRVLRS